VDARHKAGHDEPRKQPDGAYAISDLNFKQLQHSPSLRANGSRECAPDDRLREAIHRRAKKEDGLLRRFAPLRKRFAFVAGNDVATRLRDPAA
jgi:hypothetical protein